MQAIQGRIWVLGDDINTDVITPGPYVDAPMEEMRKHVLEAICPEFPLAFKAGDIIVSGANFGCGSSRETAPEVLKTMGIGAVIAQSFARIFFRNAVALGIPVLQVKTSPTGFSTGDQVKIDVESAQVVNLTTNKKVFGIPLYQGILEILRAGGFIPMMQAMVKNRKEPK